MMPKTLTKAGRKPNDGPVPDHGCQYAPKCADCPWRVCIKELPMRERHDFIHAWRTVLAYVAVPDRTSARGQVVENRRPDYRL